jgi:hypothetical protein
MELVQKEPPMLCLKQMFPNGNILVSGILADWEEHSSCQSAIIAFPKSKIGIAKSHIRGHEP